MTKNIIIAILVVALVFLLLSNREFKVNTQVETIETTEVPQPSETSVPASTSEEKISGESLDLSNKGLDKLPSYVLDRTSLEILDISNNDLTGALPGEIRFLQNLKVLKASNNNMIGVPAEVGQLKNLEVLDLSDNQLTGLPQEMGNLKNLKKLDLSGNNYSEQDLEIIKQGLPSDVEIIL